jgi:hypothetical protein
VRNDLTHPRDSSSRPAIPGPASNTCTHHHEPAATGSHLHEPNDHPEALAIVRIAIGIHSSPRAMTRTRTRTHAQPPYPN